MTKNKNSIQKDQKRLPPIGITLGDPVGVGPEIVLKSVTRTDILDICRPIIFGDINALMRAEEITGLSCSYEVIEEFKDSLLFPSTQKIYLFRPSRLSEAHLMYGKPTKETASATINMLEKAVNLSLSGDIWGLVTAPINKSTLKKVGFPFEGHTQFLAHYAGTKEYGMMLAGQKLKVLLVTIHVPLKEVSSSLTIKKIVDTISLGWKAMRLLFHISSPRIAVSGLNPHASEDGHFGNEENDIIAPAVLKAKEMAIDVKGPFSPDTVFYRAYNGEFDLVISMYHDQGLIPLKLVHFRDAINITLGLPFVRASVDHGTAYEIAGKGIAREESLIEAIKFVAHVATINRGQRLNWNG